MIADAPICRMAAYADWTKMSSFKRLLRFQAFYDPSADDDANQGDGFSAIEDALAVSDEKD